MNENRIIRELNPLHDLSRHPQEIGLSDLVLYVMNVYKYLARGGIAGAILGSTGGAITGLVSGGDLSQNTLDGMLFGASWGATLDLSQYVARYSIHRFKYTIVDALELYRCITSN